MVDENTKKLQEKYAEMQQIEAYMQVFTQQLEKVNEQITDLEQTQEWLQDITKVKHGTESLIPLSGGIFIKAKIENAENLLVNVGSGTVVAKSLLDTRNMLSEQEKQLRTAEQELTTEMQKLTLKAQNLQEEMQKLMKNV